MPQIGKYELQESLGGGMSTVWRARDTVLGRTVAVKILTEQGCTDPESKIRFLEEARIASNFHHDNIIAIHDYGEENGRPYMVMEFLTGEDLRHAIRGNRTGDLRGRLGIGLQIARALEFVHAQKIVHRDIKPENIHIDPSGKVKLMDFGIAKSQGMSLTQTGVTVGTPYYMAPEQVLGEPVTEQVDVYAFGVLLHELFTGRRAVEADTVERLFYRILNEEIDLNSLTQVGVPEPVRRLIGRSTAKKREERIGTMREVRQEIERLLENTGAPAVEPAPRREPQQEPDREPPRRRSGDLPRVPRKALVAIAAGILVLAGAGVGVYLLTRPVPPPKPKPEQAPEGMVLIPGGEFRAGQERRVVSLPDFYIDKTEVTNAQYKVFCLSTGRNAPVFGPGQEEFPVSNVTYTDAEAYAAWVGKRLPAGLEWEKAARGTDGRKYPWGDDPRPDLAAVNTKGDPKDPSLQPVSEALFSNGASPFGVLHMAGNVAEWVNERVAPSPQAVEIYSKEMTPPPAPNEPWYAIKGGSFRRPIEFTLTYEFAAVPARFASDEIGFRCAKDDRR